MRALGVVVFVLGGLSALLTTGCGSMLESSPGPEDARSVLYVVRQASIPRVEPAPLLTPSAHLVTRREALREH